MKSRLEVITTSIAIVGLSVALFALPVPRPISAGAFGLFLVFASYVAYQSGSPILGCLLLASMTALAAFVASLNASTLVEFRLLLGATIALVAGGVTTIFLKAKVRACAVAGPVTVTIDHRATYGELMRERFQARKSALPKPRYISASYERDFRSIVGMDEFKKKLLDAGKQCVGPEDANGILLYGDPGNGKTAFAKALAGELGIEFIPIQRRMSKWVGEESEALFNQIEEARLRSPCMIFLDEVDSLLGSREAAAGPSHTNESNALVNRLLSFLTDNRAHAVVIVAATNFLDRIDPAARRPGRFDFVFEVPNPDLNARRGLLLQGISRHAPNLQLDSRVIDSLSKRWNGFNVATILGITAQIPQFLREKKLNTLGFDDFMAIHRNQQGIANRVDENTKSFSDMTYPDEQGKAIKDLIARMNKSFELEEAGGSAPSGVLFYGGPGTGKTETARMIAKETKWAFFPVAGPDLAGDPKMIEDLLKKVKNARPAIIFIDEADDLLGNRATNPYKASTNKLLEAMDGAGGRLNDVLWVASTNFADNLDSAVVRPGRFTEKIAFLKPLEKSILSFAKAFFADPRRKAVMHASWEEVADVLQDCSIADANGILVHAWNLTLTSTGGVDSSNPVTVENLRKARDAICAINYN